MPYLTEKDKVIHSNAGLDDTAHYIADLDNEKFAGVVNWHNYTIAVRRFTDGSIFKRYIGFSIWVGSMLLCILEVWRRVVVPYEDKKIKENGDVK